jgi:hypothetical protein
MSGISKIPITKESSVGETAREKDVKNRRETFAAEAGHRHHRLSIVTRTPERQRSA